jgi:Flp pilus assembly protein TadD
MKAIAGMGHYMTGDLEEAYRWAEAALREQPIFYFAACTMAASAARLGRPDDARKAIAQVLQGNPGVRISNIHKLTSFQRPEDMERWKEDLAKAGLPA